MIKPFNEMTEREKRDEIFKIKQQKRRDGVLS